MVWNIEVIKGPALRMVFEKFPTYNLVGYNIGISALLLPLWRWLNCSFC